MTRNITPTRRCWNIMIPLLVTATLTVTLLSGCGQDDPVAPNPIPSVADSGKPVVAIDPQAIRAVEDMIARISVAVAEPLRDNVRIDMRVWTGPGGLRESDVTLWRAQDRSGVVRTTSTTEGGTMSTHIQNYPKGTMAVNLDTVPSSAPILAGQMQYYTEHPHRSLLGVAALINTEHCLTRDQIIATLQVLADSGRLRYLGDATDQIGRHGKAFAMDSPADNGGLVRDVLIFDPSSGRLLSREQMPVPADEHPLPANSLVLYIGCANTDSRPAL